MNVNSLRVPLELIRHALGILRHAFLCWQVPRPPDDQNLASTALDPSTNERRLVECCKSVEILSCKIIVQGACKPSQRFCLLHGHVVLLGCHLSPTWVQSN